MTTSRQRRPWSLCLRAFLLATLTAGAVGQVPAASQDIPSWSTPVNLSGTGGTSNPHLVVSGSGRRHVVWDLSFADSAYRFGDGQTWADSISIELPFKDLPATLVPDRAGNIHAFWVDDEGALFHKTVPANSLSSSGSWFGGQRLATSVAAFAVALDGQNRFHLAFIRAEDTPSLPAGVYYLASRSGGSAWTLPRPLYESNYYQQYRPSTDPGGGAPDSSEKPAIHIEAETGDETTRVYVTWDNPAVKRVFQSASADAGTSWSAVEEVDGPTADDPYVAPLDLAAFAVGEDVVRTWKAVAEGGNCSPRSQVSDDGGVSWSDVRSDFGGIESCPERLQSFRLENGLRLFLVERAGRVQLVAWDGQAWSPPQPQPALDYFVNSETFDFVDMGCYQSAIASGMLVVVGCDEGPGGDVWSTERSLADVPSWFADDPNWIASAVEVEGDAGATSLAMAADDAGRTHLLWMEPTGDEARTDLRYAGVENGQVLGPFPVLSGQSGDPQALALTVSDAGRLLAVWADAETGDIKFDRTLAGQADAASSWFAPDVLANTASAGRSPALVAGPAGEVRVSYTVPINEQRGIYLVSSDDDGQTWGDSKEIFDGAAGDCAVVGASDLALTADGRLHAIWACLTPPGGSGPIALLYAASADGGETWSTASTLVETPPTWSRLLALPDGSLHLLWRETRGGRSYTFHRHSADSGVTWSMPSTIAAAEGEVAFSAATSDDLGRIHYLQVVEEPPTPPLVRYQMWDGSRWLPGRSLALAAETVQQIGGLDAAVDSDGQLVAAVAESGNRNPSGDSARRIVVGSIAPPPPGRSVAQTTPALPTSTPEQPAAAEPTGTPAAPPPPAFSSDVTRGPAGLAVAVAAALASTVILLGVALAQRFRRPPAETPPPDDPGQGSD